MTDPSRPDEPAAVEAAKPVEVVVVKRRRFDLSVAAVGLAFGLPFAVVSWAAIGSASHSRDDAEQAQADLLAHVADAAVLHVRIDCLAHVVADSQVAELEIQAAVARGDVPPATVESTLADLAAARKACEGD